MVSVKKDKAGGGISLCDHGIRTCQGPLIASTSSDMLPSNLISTCSPVTVLCSHWSLSWSSRSQWLNSVQFLETNQLEQEQNTLGWFASHPTPPLFFFFPSFPFFSLHPRKEKEVPNPTLYWQFSKPSSELVLRALIFFDVLFGQNKWKPKLLLEELHMSDSAIKGENGTSHSAVKFGL